MDIQLPVATFALISDLRLSRPIEIVCNRPKVEIDNSPKKSPKYKKVGKTTKALLMKMVESGSSIVAVHIYLNLGLMQTGNQLFDSQVDHPSQEPGRPLQRAPLLPHRRQQLEKREGIFSTSSLNFKYSYDMYLLV